MEAKRLLLGDEAVALAAIDSGLSGVYAYPGTPSTEITEFIQKDHSARERGVHSRWCTNEKTAMEAALGMSYAGKRALVCMKHVGMNVCADPFINSAVTGVNGGLIVLAADDPSMHSSQNEQDSRFYGNFAMIPIFEPSNQQEAYDMVGRAFDLSEALHVPVMMRMVTRLAHSRAEVSRRAPRAENPLDPSDDRGWILLPAIARRQYLKLIDKQPEMLRESDSSTFNTLTLTGKKGVGIIACGIAYNYVQEAAPEVSGILKL
ncbi:MAG: indolepyruvate ferredoxin oxidoreductase, partial [Bacteroidales bacterium]|nr:indolepyruvate ferredoxin oxidoreductase [Bacteroidales bacterium]